MAHDKDSSSAPKKVFDFFVGCAQIASTIIGIIGLIISFIALVWAVRNPNAVPQIIDIISGEATATPQVIILPSNTPLPTYTPFPTYTLFPTNSPIPTATATVFVPPVDGIFFQDNFDKNMSTDWVVGSGTWMISNGRLTMLPGDPYTDDYSWISLRKPEWKNYILSINVNDTYTNIGNQFVIVVRDGSAQRIGVAVNSLAEAYFALIGDGWSRNSPITGEKFDFPVNTNTNIEIEVQNDNYILRVNGRELQNITLSGFHSGGISIGLNCDSDCPSFDDVKITYLP